MVTSGKRWLWVLKVALVVQLGTGPSPARAKVIEGTVVGQCPARSQNPFRLPIHTTCPPPLTDGTRPTGAAATSATPWTHPIRCVTGQGENDEERVYCLYTDEVFAGQHGVSLITTPEVAADTIGADAFEDRPSYGGSRKRLLIPGPIADKQGRPSYAVEPVPGKGLGVVARRKIRQGEILMLDLPAIVMGKKFLEEVDPKSRRRLLRRAVAQLPAATQTQVFRLAKSTGGEEIDDILGTNTVSVKLGHDDMHLALYPELSRINHACSPNAFYKFSPRTLSAEVIAYRDIQPGEEVTISYAQLTLSRTARREFLQKNYHFDCKCSLCRASADEATLSEDRRRDMRRLQGTLVSASRGGEYLMALQAAEDLMGTAAVEGVPPLAPEMHDIMAAIYLDMRDWSNAGRYARMALEGWRRLDSVDDTQLSNARWFIRFLEEAKEIDRRRRETIVIEDEDED